MVIGTREETSIRDLALLIKRISNYQVDLGFDTARPDGAPRKLMFSALLKNMVWKYRIGLLEGLSSIVRNDFQMVSNSENNSIC